MNKSKKHLKAEYRKTIFKLYKTYLKLIDYYNENKGKPQKTLEELMVETYVGCFSDAKPTYDFVEIPSFNDKNTILKDDENGRI